MGLGSPFGLFVQEFLGDAHAGDYEGLTFPEGVTDRWFDSEVDLVDGLVVNPHGMHQVDGSWDSEDEEYGEPKEFQLSAADGFILWGYHWTAFWIWV